MIVLDTNVVSEIMKPAPFDAIVHWLASQKSSSVFTTVITQAEILYGIEVLPAGKRKHGLAVAAGKLFDKLFLGKILPFREESARQYSRISASRRALGRPIAQLDAMIAAIAHVQGAAVATRNTSDFEQCGIRLINPWTTTDVH
jgi:predicted nucleic acid-binding protein